jgi:hypothetical protein
MKKCKVCTVKFEPRNSKQMVCSPQCAIAFAKSDRGKAHAVSAKKQVTSTQKKAFRANDKSWHTKQAQISVNKRVRERDAGQPCISCQKPPKAVYAGHYKSVGAHPELRFNADNIHAQCYKCNNMLSGNPAEYNNAFNALKRFVNDRKAI